MTTSMEQVQIINNAKLGKLPSELEKEHPSMAAIIKKSLSYDPSERPALAEIGKELKLLSEGTN